MHVRCNHDDDHFDKYILTNTFWQIHFDIYILNNTFWQIHFDKHILTNTFWQIPFDKYILTNTFFFNTVGDYHPVLFINKETHMKKETNRHRLDYWAPVLPSSPPSSHVMVVIQRKNWGYILHTADINRNWWCIRARCLAHKKYNKIITSSDPQCRSSAPSFPPFSIHPLVLSKVPPTTWVEFPLPPQPLNSALSFSSSLLSLLPAFHPSTTRFETTVTEPNHRRGRGSNQKL